MVVVGLFVQQSYDAVNLILQCCAGVPISQILAASREFGEHAQKMRASGVIQIRGQIVASVTMRVLYNLVNDVFVGVVLSSSSNPFEASIVLDRAKAVLISAAKGATATPTLVQKKYGEIYLALELVLLGHDGVASLGSALLYPGPRPAPPTEIAVATAEFPQLAALYEKDYTDFEAVTSTTFAIPLDSFATAAPVKAPSEEIDSLIYHEPLPQMVAPTTPTGPIRPESTASSNPARLSSLSVKALDGVFTNSSGLSAGSTLAPPTTGGSQTHNRQPSNSSFTPLSGAELAGLFGVGAPTTATSGATGSMTTSHSTGSFGSLAFPQTSPIPASHSQSSLSSLGGFTAPTTNTSTMSETSATSGGFSVNFSTPTFDLPEPQLPQVSMLIQETLTGELSKQHLGVVGEIHLGKTSHVGAVFYFKINGASDSENIAPLFDKFMANPQFLTESSEHGPYSYKCVVPEAATSAAVVLAKYKLVSTAIRSPITVTSKWDIQPSAATVQVHVGVNSSVAKQIEELGVLVAVSGGVSGMECTPNALWSAKQNKALFKIPTLSSAATPSADLNGKFTTKEAAVQAPVSMQFRSPGALCSVLRLQSLQAPASTAKVGKTLLMIQASSLSE